MEDDLKILKWKSQERLIGTYTISDLSLSDQTSLQTVKKKKVKEEYLSNLYSDLTQIFLKTKTHIS